MARVAPSDAIVPPVSQGVLDKFLDGVRTHVPKRATQLKIKVLVTLILVMCVTTAGIQEVSDLHARSTATARALHDPTCWVHIYPYDEDDVEVTFEIAYREAEDKKASEEDDMFSIDSNRVLDVQLGSMNHLISDECTLLIMGGEGGVVFNQAATSTSPTNSTEPVQFGSCRAKPGGGDIVFEEVVFDETITRASGIATLGLWMLLRILYLCREVSCHNFEITHPITTTRTDEGCGVPQPLGVLLEKLIGGGRLLLRNVYYVIVRPYITFAIMSSSLLTVFSSIHLNDDCPQLIMQTGHHIVAMAALALASMVVCCCLLQWIFDIYIYTYISYLLQARPCMERPFSGVGPWARACDCPARGRHRRPMHDRSRLLDRECSSQLSRVVCGRVALPIFVQLAVVRDFEVGTPAAHLCLPSLAQRHSVCMLETPSQELQRGRG